MRNIATISLAFGFAFAVSPVLAADVKSEIMTAEQHAELAAQAQSLDAVQMHLHHTLNCDRGAEGRGVRCEGIESVCKQWRGRACGFHRCRGETEIESSRREGEYGIERDSARRRSEGRG